MNVSFVTKGGILGMGCSQSDCSNDVRMSSEHISAGASKRYVSAISSVFLRLSVPSSSEGIRYGAKERTSWDAGAGVCTSTACHSSKASSRRYTCVSDPGSRVLRMMGMTMEW